MADYEPNDEAIAVLVDVARTAGRDLNVGQRRELHRLVSEGLVTPVQSGQSPQAYKVTAKGQGLLDARGVGANES